MHMQNTQSVGDMCFEVQECNAHGSSQLWEDNFYLIC
jgi:hypothetical protein